MSKEELFEMLEDELTIEWDITYDNDIELSLNLYGKQLSRVAIPTYVFQEDFEL